MNMKRLTKKDLPAYFEMPSGLLVKIDYDPKTDEVYGETAGGRPYSNLKPIAEGERITEKEFYRASK